ncbi:MAG: transketolase [Firmicutes bacterium]|nr:transketolase [Bacillota bacterium]
MLFKGKENSNSFEKKIVDHIRCLGIDMIEEAKSGHPGIVLGASPILYTLYGKHLNICPENPNWINRDRFVMSAGHGSALLYSTLYMAGYDISLNDLKKFRKIDSKTPGHPEYGVTPGVDMSTGPLGQGFATAVGMAIAEEYQRAYFQSKGQNIINHYTYVLCGDGDLMEGVSYEAASLAGTLKLNRLIVLYDNNKICLDGEADKVFTEKIPERFNALNWNVFIVNDGEDLDALDNMIEKAKTSIEKPSIIIVNTTIGRFSKNQGTNKVHGAPLGKEDVSSIKEQLSIRDIPFSVSNESMVAFQEMIKNRMQDTYQKYEEMIKGLPEDIQKEVSKLIDGDVTLDDFHIEIDLPETTSEAPRITGGKVLNSLAKRNPFLIGGSADLSSSTKTYLNEQGDFSYSNRLGRNIWFGVREHAMGAILNGLCLSGLRPFGSTFLTFSDYLKPSIRLAALMDLATTYIFTHDSISIGEDGPTHQPVEQLVMLRSIPNLEVFRPCDMNEIIGTYKYVMGKKNGPSAIVLSRNNVVIKEMTSIKDVVKGAYILKEERKNLGAIIIASGEEVDIALSVSSKLEEKGYDIRVISMPSIERFKSQKQKYKDELLPLGIKTFVIEASSSYSWHEFVYNDKYLINVNEFGKSGNREDVYQEFEFDIESITEKIEDLLK